MDRRSFLGGMSCSAGIVLSGCMYFDNSGDWETVRNCTEETAIRVESVGTALEDWLESPRRLIHLDSIERPTKRWRHSKTVSLMFATTTTTSRTKPSSQRTNWTSITGKKSLLYSKNSSRLHEGRTAATAVVEASGEPEELDAEEEETVESVTEEYDDVLEEVEPLIPDNTDS
ncbi:hypothetical protein D8S78_02390 [Natrialba swarupiae]|nr:hypothetical protein [Natrialba swarupiae]